MKNKEINKYKHKGYSYKPYKFIKKKLLRIERKDLNIPLTIKFK